MSQAEVARELGVHRVTVSRWERGVGSMPRYRELILSHLENLEPSEAGSYKRAGRPKKPKEK